MAAHRRFLRADQLLSCHGYCSRRQARVWLNAGRLTLGGNAISDPATRLDPRQVRVDGAPVEFPDGLFVQFHKPAGYICSHEDRDGPMIYELLPPRWLGRNPPLTSIGRLDKDATGLLLLTDRGDLVHSLTSPRHKVPKVYEVELSGDLRPEWVELFASGELLLEGEKKPCLPARLDM